jgi:hypothetical protein
MKQRCPHCQTTPLRADAETCWYCGKDYIAKRKLPRTAGSLATRAAASRRRAEPKIAAGNVR